MSIAVELTCRDAEVPPELERLARHHAANIQPYADLIDLCHVIIKRRPAATARMPGWAVAIDLICHDGRVLTAYLRDRHMYFQSVEAALDEAFFELGGWLSEVSPQWRERNGKRNQHRGTPGSDWPGQPHEPDWGENPPQDCPANSFHETSLTSSLHGTHHFVG